ncbi:MAG: type II toxin-antitoxin system VapC family toxin [Anaerolineales bacterium]
MNLVIDSSVVIKWFMDEPLMEQARDILYAYQNNLVNLFAPDLLIAEVGNILWKKHRFHGLEVAETIQILGLLQQFEIEYVPSYELIHEALQIAVQHQRTVYDALYLALSQSKLCMYVTADQKFVNGVQNVFKNVISLADWKNT